jgi:hypothetical protein
VVRPGGELARELSGTAQTMLATSWRAFSWSVGAGRDAGAAVVRRALDGESPAAIVGDATGELRTLAARLLSAISSTTAVVADGAAPFPSPAVRTSGGQFGTTAELRARAAELLARSADVHDLDAMHPAYGRILDEMAPDEARIMRYLTYHGPQPTVDVRTNRPLGIGSELIASGLSMIGEHAGCRDVDRTNAYLNNMFRLGLVWFSRESVDPQRYQLVEAQPKVVEAMKRAGRAPRTVHRSIHLTPFGLDFATTCLPLDRARVLDLPAVEQPVVPDPHG